VGGASKRLIFTIIRYYNADEGHFNAESRRSVHDPSGSSLITICGHITLDSTPIFEGFGDSSGERGVHGMAPSGPFIASINSPLIAH
jgi:hypothetical protein